MSSEKINQLQLLQQNIQTILAQKQQLQSQLVELDSALTEIGKTEKSYKILGNIMVAASKDNLSKELSEKKEIVEVRLKNFQKQEERLKKDIEELQKEVVSELKSDKGQKDE